MFPGLRYTTLAMLVIPAALFTRRAKAGWLDELDGIRDEALDSPGGEVAMAMADVAPLPETDADRSPLAELEAPLPRAAAPHNPNRPANAQRSLPVLGIEAGQSLPYEETAPAVAPPPPPPPTSTLPPPPPPTAPLPPPPDLPTPEPAAAVVEPVESDAPAVAPTTIEPPVAQASGPELVDAPPISTQPAPHPVRPHEMWHPPVGPVPVETRPEPVADDEVVDPQDLVDDEGTTARFRFARLRAVAPIADEPAPVPAPEVEVASIGNVGELFAAEPPVGDPIVDEGATPLVPPVATTSAGSLITGPVTRRDRRADGPRRPILPTDVQDPSRATADPDQELHDEVEAEHAERADEPEPTAPVAVEADADVASVGPDAVPHAEPVAEAPAVVEPVPAEATPEPERLTAAPDGIIELGDGVLRLAEDAVAEVVRADGSVSIALASGWCWADRPVDAEPVVVLLPAGPLTIPAGTTALAALEPDGTAFVVVVEGEAVLVHHSGRLRLRAGAMVLAPEGAEPQADVASEDEILSDPLVQRNLSLDSERNQR